MYFSRKQDKNQKETFCVAKYGFLGKLVSFLIVFLLLFRKIRKCDV